MDNSPISRLSAELRNHIAELALYHEEGVDIADKKIHHALALTQTCREMRQDYTSLFYSTNNFTLNTTSGHNYLEIKHFSNCIGKLNTKLAGPITMVLTVPYYDCSDTIYCAFLEFENDGPFYTLIQSFHVKIIGHDGEVTRSFQSIRKKKPLNPFFDTLYEFALEMLSLWSDPSYNGTKKTWELQQCCMRRWGSLTTRYKLWLEPDGGRRRIKITRALCTT